MTLAAGDAADERKYPPAPPRSATDRSTSPSSNSEQWERTLPVSDAPRTAYGRIAARGGLIALVGFGGSQLVTLLTYVVLARLILPSQLGVFAAGSLITGVGLLFAESGMLAALLTRRERFEEAANTAFVWNVVSGCGLALLSLGVSPLVGVVFRHRGVVGVSAALSGILWLRALSIVPDAILQRRLSFLRRVVIDPLAMVAFGVVAISTTSTGAGVWGLVLASYASTSTRAIGTWSFARWRPHPRAASMALWREIIAFSRSVLLSEIIRHGVANLDVLLIGRFAGAASLGQYRYGQRVASQPGGAWVAAGAYVVLPIFSRFSDDVQRLRAACLRVLRWMAIVLFPVALSLSALGPTITTLVFGREWRAAGWALMALAGVSIGLAVVSVASETFKVLGRPGELPKVHAVSAVASAGCMLALLPLGMIGVAGGLSLGWCIVAAYAIKRMQAVVGLPAKAVLHTLVLPLLVGAAVSLIGYVADTGVVHADRHGAVIGLIALSAELLAMWTVYAAVLTMIDRDLRRALLSGLRWLRGFRLVSPRKVEGT